MLPCPPSVRIFLPVAEAAVDKERGDEEAWRGWEWEWAPRSTLPCVESPDTPYLSPTSYPERCRGDHAWGPRDGHPVVTQLATRVRNDASRGSISPHYLATSEDGGPHFLASATALSRSDFQLLQTIPSGINQNCRMLCRKLFMVKPCLAVSVRCDQQHGEEDAQHISIILASVSNVLKIIQEASY
ncbi:hypothetical protein BHM03_00006829 [Ensete ventricosum]|nr:hypothetical protein BHM03_00006829 [Ensete ventricosum]